MKLKSIGIAGFLAASFLCAAIKPSMAERIDISKESSIRILQSGKVLASWPAEVGGSNFGRLFYVVAGGQIYLCRVEERNRDVDARCFARSTLQR